MAPWGRHLRWALIAVVACSGEQMLPTPTVRVDLRDRLPPKVLRRLLAMDTSYPCRREVTLAASGVTQRFLVTWQVFDGPDDRRLITAVQVEPEGPCTGGRGAEASAALDDPREQRTTGAVATVVPIQIQLRATRGCRAVERRTRIEISTHDAGCQPPEPTVKIFSDKGAEAAREAGNGTPRDQGR